MTEEQSNNQGTTPIPEPSQEAPAAASVPPQQPVSQPMPQQQPPMGQSMPQQQPPMGHQMPQQNMPHQQVPMYHTPQPAYVPAMLTQLTGGMKFGWFVVGALLGIGGIVLSWLVNADKYPEVKSEALKWTIIGFVVWVILGVILSFVFAGMIAAMIGSMGYSSGYYGSW